MAALGLLILSISLKWSLKWVTHLFKKHFVKTQLSVIGFYLITVCSEYSVGNQDKTFHVFHRIGKKSTRLVRAAALKLSQEIFNMINRPVTAMVTKCLEG